MCLLTPIGLVMGLRPLTSGWIAEASKLLIIINTYPRGLVPVARPAVMGVCFGKNKGLFSDVYFCLKMGRLVGLKYCPWGGVI